MSDVPEQGGERPKPTGEGPADRTASGRQSGLKSGRTIQIKTLLKQELASMLREALRPVLVVLSGPDAGRRIVLSGSGLLGRDPAADFSIRDEGASWQHARIEDRGDCWTIVDLGSTNGTFVGGQPIEEKILGPGDTVMIGETLMRFELRSAIERAADEELQRLLDIDDLSGLYLRRKFDERVAEMIRGAQTYGGSVGMVVMDMDGVKGINDTHGHLFGAYSIGETGRVISRVLGGRGIAARFGGDEFVAALPGLTTDQTFTVAEEIHAGVNAHHYEKDGVVLRPGISIGVASFPADAGDQLQLFDRADKALYRAKQSGKNRVCR